MGGVNIPLPSLDVTKPTPAPFPDALSEFQRASALKTAAGQQQIQQQTVQQNDIALQQQQMQLADMKKLRDLAPQYVQKSDDGTVKGYDVDGLANAALGQGINPQTVAGLRNTYAESVKNLAGANKAQLDLEQEKNDKAFEVLEGLRGLAPKTPAATPQVQGGPQAAPAQPQAAPQSPVAGTGGMPSFMLPNMPQGGGAQPTAQSMSEQPPAVAGIPQVQTTPEMMQGYHQAIMKLAHLGVNIGQLNPNQFPTDDQLNGFEAGLGTHKQALADAETLAKTQEAAGKGAQAQAESEAVNWKPAGEGTLVNVKNRQMIHGVAPVERQELTDYLNNPSLDPGKQKDAATFASWKAKQSPMAMVMGNQLPQGANGNPALDQAAERYAQTGVLPPGFARSPGTLTAIMNRAAELHPEGNIGGNAAVYAANKSALTQLQSQASKVDAFENTAGKNLDLFLNTAKKVVDSGSPWINQPLRTVDQKGLGDADQAAFNAARATALTEISKVLNSANANGVLSDSARHEVSSLIGTDATLKQIVSASNILKQDMANRHQSYQDEIAKLQGQLGRKSGGQTSTSNSAEPTGKAVSLAAAKQLPSMQGKSDDEIKAAIQAAGHTVAP